MADHRLEGPGENGSPVPRDLPDQQATDGEDPWDVAPARADEEDQGAGGDAGDGGADTEGGPADDVPDTDEAGTGRQGAPHSATVHPEHPVPEEPAD
ncbi:hypothetical protein [Streptomyces sp. NPDC002328]|uniref:hypothetical protein n=1 Tax=Streptomyces sp. NPDC002328 TaxID=3364642 RepID=UPI003685F677